VLDDPALLAHVDEMGARPLRGLRELPGVTEVRGRGLMLAAEVDFDAPSFVKRALEEQALVLNATGPRTGALHPAAGGVGGRDQRGAAAPGRATRWMTTGVPAQVVVLARAHAEALGDAR
jgi:hypothetical protein